MADFVDLSFELAFKYRNPVMILSDGVIGQMMEKVVLPPIKPRRTEEEIAKECPWATIGRPSSREPNIMTSLELKPEVMEEINIHLQEKYQLAKDTETRCEITDCDDADYVIVAFGSAARITEKSMEIARSRGIKAGLFRPITLWPFPEKELRKTVAGKKGILVAEINAGQMIEDVKLAIGNSLPTEHFGRLGGIVPDPEEIVNALKTKLIDNE
jgi:2-oxoglutarate ferredoxin oxidoreductase subunit alpha